MKRFFEFVAASLLLVVFMPIMLIVALMVWLLIERPVLYSQQRPGKDTKIFRMYKFRSMSDARSSSGLLLSDAERLGKFGHILRSSSLDELPALWNVLRGEMSFVGPRPLLSEYLPLYNAEQARRHEVKPGITGWAQVNGRNAITWNEKFALDVWYVDNRTLLLDLRILVLTVKKVFFRSDISAEGEATMSKFTGQGGV